MPRVLLSFIVFFMHSVSAQHFMLPSGKFLSDTTKVGQPIRYALAMHHPKNMEVFFPDSNSNFFPFEFISKEYFPTETKDSISKDSVVYTLRTFEMQPRVSLGLAIHYIADDDTSRLYSIPDSIVVFEFLQSQMDHLSLKSSTNLVSMDNQFNYPYFISISLLILFSGWAFYKFFGASFLRNYRLYNMYQNHIKFIREFEDLKEECIDSPSILKIEKALSVWKEYLSDLEDEPIYTYTTTEIISLYNQEELKYSLQEIDRCIYKGEISTNTEEILDALSKFSNKEYKRIREELQRGN